MKPVARTIFFGNPSKFPQIGAFTKLNLSTMPLTLLRSRLPGTSLAFFLFIIFQLSFSLARASDEIIEVETNNGLSMNGADLGGVNPCSGPRFVLNAFVIPAGYSFQKAIWFGNGAQITTSFSSSAVVPVTVASENSGDVFTVFAEVFYVSGSSTIASFSNSISLGVNSMLLNSINASPDDNLGCTSPLTYSTSPASSSLGGVYVPPSGTYAITWALPANWTFSGASTGNAITAIPDATDAGDVVATLTLPGCGFVGPHTTQVVTRPTPAPTFGSNPTDLCDNSSYTYAINAPCGATSYVWTLSGNTGATFQATGSQSFSTTSTSAVISTATVGNSSVNLSVAAVYPGGVTGTAVSANTATGVGAPTVLRLINGEQLVGPGPFTFSMAALTSQTVTSYNWSVSPHATISGQNTQTVTFTTPHLNSGQSGEVSILVQYGTTCSGLSPTNAYDFIDEGSGMSGLPPLKGSITLQPHAGMSQLAILSDADENSSPIKAVNVFTTTGQLMKKAGFGGANTTEYLDIHDLPNGIYVVQVITAKGATTQKFAVLH